MDGIMNNNQLTIVKEYVIDNPLIQNIDSIINRCYRDCHYKYFHTFKYECIYDINFRNITNNETVNLTIIGESMGMYELNKKLSIARRNGFKFNQINKLTIKIYSNLFCIKIDYHLKSGASPLHRQFFMKLLKNDNYIQTYCNDPNNPFHFGCHQWYEYKNQGILT